MPRPPRSRTALIILAALAVAAVGWTVLALRWAPLGAWDARLLAPPRTATSTTAQIAGAIALLTWPVLQYLALLALAWWALRRRLRSLAAALVLTAALAYGVTQALKFAIGRPRPEPHVEVITAIGYAYPSGHLVGVVASSVAVGATLAVTRRSPRVRLGWQVGAVLLVLVVALDRWILRAHWVSDLVGGALVGGFVAVLALVVTGVSVPVAHEIVSDVVRELVRPREPAEAGRRCAVIYNPSKVLDWPTFRRHVEYEARTRGFGRPLWLETAPDDPGRAMTRQAVAEQVDLVIGAGGDGTIRVICSELAGTGIPFGLVPAGTGNLLARNIGIPLDENAALAVAFDGPERAVDLVALRVDDEPVGHFAVMAGIGMDAVIMQGTSPDLKRAVGPAAYFVSAARHANHPALHLSLQVDDQPVLRRRAHLILIGNVGLITGNIQMLPDALPDDGLLDVLVASPRSTRDWVRLVTSVVTRRRRPDEQLDRLTGRRVSLRVEERDHYQLDGDTEGQCNRLTAEVVPGALRLRAPQPVTQSTPKVSSEASSASSVGAGRSSGRSE